MHQEPNTEMDLLLRTMIYLIESDAATHPGSGLDISRAPGRAVTLIEESLQMALPETRTLAGQQMLAALLEPDVAVGGRDPNHNGHPDVERVLERLNEVLKESERRRKANAAARTAAAAEQASRSEPPPRPAPAAAGPAATTPLPAAKPKAAPRQAAPAAAAAAPAPAVAVEAARPANSLCCVVVTVQGRNGPPTVMLRRNPGGERTLLSLPIIESPKACDARQGPGGATRLTEAIRVIQDRVGLPLRPSKECGHLAWTWPTPRIFPEDPPQLGEYFYLMDITPPTELAA